MGVKMIKACAVVLLLGIFSPSPVLAMRGDCCKCKACPGNPLGTGTEASSSGTKACSGKDCAHGGCENISACGGGNVSSRLPWDGSLKALRDFHGAELLSLAPKQLLVNGALGVSLDRSSLVLYSPCDGIVGLVPLPRSAAVRLLPLLRDRDRIGPLFDATPSAVDGPQRRVVLVSAR